MLKNRTIIRTTTTLLGLLLWPYHALAAEGYECLIQPNMMVDVSSAVEGVVERVHVERSDMVTKGQLLVELETGVEIAAVNQARARSQMQGELNSRHSSLECAERRLERIKQLFKKGLVSSHDMDEAETQVQLAIAELHKAEDEQRLAELELQRAEEALKLRRIRSPFQGVVVERYKSPGESVEDKPIVKLAQLDPLRVEVFMPAVEFGHIKQGIYARVRPENAASRDYLAEATQVDRIIDAASGTFTVRLELPNPDHKIPSGLRCNLSFLSESESATIRARQARVAKPEKVTPDFDGKLNDAGQTTPAAPDMGMMPAGYASRDAGKLEQAEPETVSQCWRVGPITDESLMTRISNKLEATVNRLTPRVTNEVGQSYFLILSPPQDTLFETKQRVKVLRNRGIRDVVALYKGHYKNHVSFGLYNKKHLAGQRLIFLKSKQIEAEIHPRHTTVQHYWLDLEHREAGLDEAALNRMFDEQQPGLQLTQRSCRDELTAKTDF